MVTTLAWLTIANEFGDGVEYASHANHVRWLDEGKENHPRRLVGAYQSGAYGTHQFPWDV